MILPHDERSCSPPVFILTGPVQGGKTTCLREILSFLKSHDLGLAGFVTHGLMEGGNRTGFIIEDISRGERTPLCGSDPAPDTVKWGRFYFSRNGIEAGIRALSCGAGKQPGLTVVDEIGPFELNGGIWAQYLREMISVSPRPLLLVIRETLVGDVIRTWNIPDPRVMKIPLDAGRVAGMIAEKIEERRGVNTGSDSGKIQTGEIHDER